MDTFLKFAHRLADASGEILLPYFSAVLEAEAKEDDSPVTRADREAESVMREMIEKEFPKHGIYGEEYGTKAPDTEYAWVIDPIDGTRAFLSQRKEWGTLIALCQKGVPVLGILNQPASGERWEAVRGGEALYNGATVRTRTSIALSNAELSTTSVNYFTPEQAHHAVQLAQQCGTTVRDGDCYAYGLLAKGARDIVIDAGLKPYDILALVPIIEAAGGKITAWDGKPITLTHFQTAMAAGDTRIHAEALEILRKPA